MNLIEELGLEKCKQIVDGAPDGSQYYCTNVEIYHLCDDLLSYECCISLSDLRATLADHSSKPCQHGYDIACLICGFGTENGVRVWRKQIETDNVTDIRNHISPTTKVIER